MSKKLPFGAELGRFEDVPAYSSDYKSASDDQYPTRGSYRGTVLLADEPNKHHYTGFKYQCVEYARRFLIARHRITFVDVRMAYEVLDVQTFQLVSSSSAISSVPAVRCYNGLLPETDAARRLRLHRPHPGFCLIWHPVGYFSGTGHIAIVAEVVEYPSSGNQKRLGVRVAEQNVHDSSWEGRHYSRELPAIQQNDGSLLIGETTRGSRVLGWIGPQTVAERALAAATASLSQQQQQQAAAAALASKAQQQQQRQQQQGSNNREDDCC